MVYTNVFSCALLRHKSGDDVVISHGTLGQFQTWRRAGGFLHPRYCRSASGGPRKETLWPFTGVHVRCSGVAFHQSSSRGRFQLGHKCGRDVSSVVCGLRVYVPYRTQIGFVKTIASLSGPKTSTLTRSPFERSMVTDSPERTVRIR